MRPELYLCEHLSLRPKNLQERRGMQLMTPPGDGTDRPGRPGFRKNAAPAGPPRAPPAAHAHATPATHTTMEKYDCKKVVGKGSYGSAIVAKRKKDGLVCVVKTIALARLSRGEACRYDVYES